MRNFELQNLIKNPNKNDETRMVVHTCSFRGRNGAKSASIYNMEKAIYEICS